jgi:hypothetical protein
MGSAMKPETTPNPAYKNIPLRKLTDEQLVDQFTRFATLFARMSKHAEKFVREFERRGLNVR